MLNTVYTLAMVLLALLLSTSVSAQNLQYRGPHSLDPADFVNGGQGVLTYNNLCLAAFNGAQMCESLDVLRSGSPPAAAAIFMWIKPSLVTAFFDGVEVNHVDATGLSTTVPGGFSCDGWQTSNNAANGLTMTGTGQFNGAVGCGNTGPVACCTVTRGKK